MQTLLSVLNTLSISDWISFIALLVSFYSVYYTHKENKYEILITDTYINIDDEYNPPMISFRIFNDSKSSITIKDIQISTLTGKTINHLQDYVPSADASSFKQDYIEILGNKIPAGPGTFMPPRIISPHEYQNPFINEVTIAANDDCEFSYYISKAISEAKIQIVTNKKIDKFKSSKLFIVKFSKF